MDDFVGCHFNKSGGIQEVKLAEVNDITMTGDSREDAQAVLSRHPERSRIVHH
jgi:hypothetical protein